MPTGSTSNRCSITVPGRRTCGPIRIEPPAGTGWVSIAAFFHVQRSAAAGSET